ncbi:MAG: TIGR02646 family protein [Magnetococcales bacterium]|nr:TIGR02646 family protein [Magnetococcales bacterium]
MRRIHKGAPPSELEKWIRYNPNTTYADLENSPAGQELRQQIRGTCLIEQHCLCAYCCDLIDDKSSHNEHVVPQSTAPHRTLDFTNIVASCETKNQCGKAHGRHPLPLTPLDPECETNLRFFISGNVKGLTENAKETVRILKLNCRKLRGKRKIAIDALIYVAGMKPDELQLADDILLGILREDLDKKTEDGCLEAFGPVLVNIIGHLLNV